MIFFKAAYSICSCALSVLGKISEVLACETRGKIRGKRSSTLSTNEVQVNKIKITQSRDFPGGPVVKTSRFHCRGHGLDPWSGN